MRDPKVLLAYPPNQLMDIETPRPDGSLGPLYLAGSLREIGIEPDLVDMAVGTSEDTLESTFFRSEKQPNGLIKIGMSWQRIREFLGREQYDIVAINSNFTPQTNMALRVAEIAKEVRLETLVITGGVNARSLYGRFFASGAIDLICTTEGERVIRQIVRRWRAGMDLRDIPGTRHKGNPQPFPLKSDTLVDPLDNLPVPAWDLLPFEKYEKIASAHGVNLTGEYDRYAPIMTSRGCPFRCAYCHISEEKADDGGIPITGEIGEIRFKSVERVLHEMEILKGLGVKKLFIEDDSLLAKKARIKEIFGALGRMGFKIANVNGVNLVHFGIPKNGKLVPDEEYMALLRDAGFNQIVFPVESGSQRILKKYATGKLDHEKTDVIELVRVARKLGIMCPVNIMIGFPDETFKEMMQSVELAKRLIDAGAPYVTFFIPIPFPGSKLFDIAIKGRHLSPSFNPDIMNWKNGVMENTTVPREMIVEIRDWAWETVNPPEHVRQRIQDSIGTRWQSSAPTES